MCVASHRRARDVRNGTTQDGLSRFRQHRNQRMRRGGFSPSRQGALTERLGDNLPFVFIDQVARPVGPNLLHVDAVTLENSNHLPDAGHVIGCVGLEPANPKSKPVTPEGGWFSKISSKPFP